MKKSSYNNNCVFCQIAAKQLPAKIVFEDEDLFAFYDIKPKADIHVLIIPKKHIATLASLESSDAGLMGKLLYRVRLLAKDLGITEGFKLVLNNGLKAGQLVPHLHFHILAGSNYTDISKI
ncbi:MAG: histidine triad nucleotide-binding protein [Patescibacteria group bacterium]|nr:histidine triad nucleotide-binding protein [Patescibacteria group bacterium]